MSKKFQKTIRPVVECEMSLRKQRICLNEMFTAAVANAPENEIDNFTAKRLGAAFQAISQLLENVGKYKRPKKLKN